MADTRETSLTEIANLHGTDKGTVGPSADWGAHNYTDIYEACFAGLRDQPITLLEIGLGVTGKNWRADIAHGRNKDGGGSIKMWHDYFHNGQIFGIDINDASHLDNDRITTMRVDQGNSEDLNSFIEAHNRPAFDIIIDDGSHRPDHQQISLSVLFEHLKPGGIYAIEDLSANGLGDPAHGRHSCNSIINTRIVLKSLVANGSFATPNAFAEPDNLASQIATITFHVPSRKDGSGKVRFQHGSERIALIRKKLAG